MTWADILASGLEEQVHWARVKSVEKAARSYAQVIPVSMNFRVCVPVMSFF